MPEFCRKNVQSLKNTMFSYHFFFKFCMKNPTLSCPYDQKNVNSINLHYIMDQKSQKTSNLSKTRCSHVNFCSNFTWKTSCSSPYLVIKRQLCQNYTLLWAQKVNNMLFFFAISHKKYPLSWPYFVKNVHSLKNTRCSHARILQKNHTALMLIFCQKNVYSLKSTMLSCYFFQIFMENPLLSHALIRSKNVNSVKTTLYGLWAKEVNRMPFFSHFA